MKAGTIIQIWVSFLLLGYGIIIMFAFGMFLAWWSTGNITAFAIWFLWLVGFSITCYVAANHPSTSKKR